MAPVLIGYTNPDFQHGLAIHVPRDIEYEDMITRFDGPFQATFFIYSLKRLRNITRFDLFDFTKSIVYVLENGDFIVYYDWALLSSDKQTQLVHAFADCGVQLFYKSVFLS
jgi:hypothetical protein